MPEELDPKKYHFATATQKRNVFLICLLIFLLSAPPFMYIYYNFAINRPSQGGKEATFEIKSGDSIQTIADSLYSADLLNSKYLFIFYAFATGNDKNIQAGVYKIPAGTSVVELIDLLQHGTNDIKVTFIEGWRVEEFALEASRKFENVDYEDFVEQAADAEGRLFPDTYSFNVDITTEQMLSIIKDVFDERTKDILSAAVLEDVGLSRGEVITLASLVEREVRDASDRPIVAGILLKRLRNEELLGVDATVQYFVGPLRMGCNLASDKICPSDDIAPDTVWWPKDLTVDELALDTPYNTRKNPGLPPAPISSVSLSALEAVLNYKETIHNFYITGNDGATYYAETLEEHNENIAKYLSR